MIVISLVLVIAAAVSLFIGLFVATETLAFIWAAIALCLVSLLLLWLGTRQRKRAEPTRPSVPVYGGAARAGGSTTPARTGTQPARTGAGEDLDELTSPDSGTVVRRTTARDRATTRVASSPSEPDDTVVVGDSTDQADRAEPDASPTEAGAAASVASATPAKKATAKKVPVKKATARKATKKAAKKAATKKAATKKAATKKAATKKAATKKATAGTTDAQARARLAQIAGVGPAKQEALLARYGSLEGIRDAAVDDIVANVRGFGEPLATRVKNELS